MPATHWAGRVAILVVLGAAVFAVAFGGVAVGVGRWAVDCTGRVTENLWTPLLDSAKQPHAAPRPISGCFRQES